MIVGMVFNAPFSNMHVYNMEFYLKQTHLPDAIMKERPIYSDGGEVEVFAVFENKCSDPANMENK